MKTNKILAAWVASTLLIALSISWASAMWGQGGWNGQWGGKGFWKTLTTEQRAELQSMSQEDRQEYITKLKAEQGYTSWNWAWKWNKDKWDHNPADMIDDIEPSDLDATEIDLLAKQYEEEMMANELYLSFYEEYGVETFKNIAESEAKHMEAVKALLDRYELPTPTNYDHIQDLYDDLKAKWALSLKDALEVWVNIEIVDIDDIITAIKASDNDDIRTVLVNIWGASYNHMRGFVKALDNAWYNTDIDYSDYIDTDDVNTKWPIKIKLAERLESEWVELPEGATSQALKEKCDKEKGWEGHGKGNGKGQWSNENMRWQWNGWNSSNVNKGQRWGQQANSNRYVNSNVVSMQAKYKDTVETKYSSRLDALDNSQLEILVEKIDALIEKVNTGTYSTVVKEKYTALLLALKEISVEKMDVDDLDLDALFN